MIDCGVFQKNKINELKYFMYEDKLNFHKS